jgi:hypothetical protein
VPDGEGGQAFAEEHIQACSTFIADIVPIVCDGCVQHRKPHCALSNGILLLPVFKPSLKFFRDPIVGVRLVLKASDLFEVPVGPGGRNAPILAFGAPDLQDWDGRHGRPPQVQTVSNRILVRINGHKCTEFRDENAAPLSVPAIRENCRRAEKRSADATRVKDGLEGIVSKRLGSRYRSGRSLDWLKFNNPNAPGVRREAEKELRK